MKTAFPKVVTIGGGTGSYTALRGLKKFQIHLSAIVNMIDDGGSSGRLRDELGVLPPGDVRQCMVALAESSKLLRDLFNYRFEDGGLKGHSFGNIFLSTLEKQTGSMKKAIAEVGKILNIKGKVVPVTFDKESKLCVDLADGKTIEGETHIDEVESMEHRAEIIKAYLKPQAAVNEDAKTAIEEADFIVIGPGDLFTSVLPNILVKGMPEVIRKSKAKKVYVMNLMTKYGQTTNHKASDHIKTLEEYLGKGVLDFVLVNDKKPKKTVLSWYEQYNEYPVEDDLKEKYKFNVIRKDLLKDIVIEQNPVDVRRRSIIRHDSAKLAAEVMELISNS
jgi:uncharacterized cofD-like protein